MLYKIYISCSVTQGSSYPLMFNLVPLGGTSTPGWEPLFWMIRTSVPSKKILRWAIVYLSAHAIAQPRENSTNCAITWTLNQLRNHVDIRPIAQPRGHSTNCATTWTLNQLRNHVNTQPIAQPRGHSNNCATTWTLNQQSLSSVKSAVRYIYDIKLGCCTCARTNGVSVRKWSDGTAHLCTLEGTTPINWKQSMISIDQQLILIWL